MTATDSGPDRDPPDPRPDFDELLLDDGAGPAARILAYAATALDSDAMAGVMKGSISGMGVIATWDLVACPVLRALGQLALHAGEEIAVERLLSRTVFEAFASVPRPEPGGPVPVLLACADGEQHTLALQALAAAVAEIGLPCSSLGAGMPASALRRAVRQIRPAVAVMWSQTAATADPAQLQALLADVPSPTVVAAGPGWITAALPDTIARSDHLADALGSIVAAVGTTTDAVESESAIRWLPVRGGGG